MCFSAFFERRVWRSAFGLRATVRADRAEMQETLLHLGWPRFPSLSHRANFRRACGPAWFDLHFPVSQGTRHGGLDAQTGEISMEYRPFHTPYVKTPP